ALNALVAGDYAAALAEKDLYVTFADVESAYNAIDWDLNIFQQATVNGYVASLAAAIEALEYKSADYTALNAKLNEFKALNASDYTNYGEAYLKVNEVNTWLNSNGSLNIKSQSLVDEQTAKVQAAIDSLIPVATAHFGANSSSTCVIDGTYIYGLKTKLTSSALKNTYLDYENVELTIENPTGGRYLGTGSTVTVEYPDGTTEVYTIVIFGDVDGDGNITADDSASLKSYINGTSSEDFTAAQKKASNLDGSRRIDVDDFSMLSSAASGAIELNQADPSESK
ncbi:MAG: dockerin type I repeat-containing protein, partial [Acutalibacteraceae bacterium]